MYLWAEACGTIVYVQNKSPQMSRLQMCLQSRWFEESSRSFGRCSGLWTMSLLLRGSVDVASS